MGPMYYKLYSRVMKGRSPDRKGVPIANNTRLYFREGGKYIDVVLHNTVVVRAYIDGKVQLFTGGWRTVTTKERINQYTGLGVYSHKGQWYIPNKTGLFSDQPIPFQEGYTYDTIG